MKVHTTCNRDCPDACGMIATVEDGRVVRLDGDPAHPITRGFLCFRTQQFPKTLQYAPDRVTRPLVRDRIGDPFVEASWDEALGRVASGLLRIRSESGPAAILNYRSGGSLGILKHLNDYLFERFGPVTIKRGDVCSGAGEAAQELDFGISDSHDLHDLRHSRHVVLWGKNPVVSSVHLLPVLREIDADITLIDPVHTAAVQHADRYVQIRPDGDLALAMAVAARLFRRGVVPSDLSAWADGAEALRRVALSRAWLDEADVCEADAEALTDVLADGPTAILVGWGMQRRSRGATIVRALDALCALSGNLGVPGGGCSFYFQRRAGFDTSFVGGLRAAPRSIPEPLLGAGVLQATDPPIRAVWVVCGNPVAMLPDSAAVARALSTRELVVVCDAFLTDTARCAHVVLPTATLLEDDDIVGAYGNHYLGEVRPVVPPAGLARTDLAILQALAPRLGLPGLLDGTAREWKARLLRVASIDDLAGGAVRNPEAPHVLFADRRFPTDNGRMHLLSSVPDAPVPPAGYPLHLLSNSTRRAQASQWSADRSHAAVVTVHPDSAQGLTDGDRARLESPVGAMVVAVRTDARQRRDVALVPKGGWLRDGACVNALVAARTTDHGEGAAYLDARVRLVPA